MRMLAKIRADEGVSDKYLYPASRLKDEFAYAIHGITGAEILSGVIERGEIVYFYPNTYDAWIDENGMKWVTPII